MTEQTLETTSSPSSSTKTSESFYLHLKQQLLEQQFRDELKKIFTPKIDHICAEIKDKKNDIWKLKTPPSLINKLIAECLPEFTTEKATKRKILEAIVARVKSEPETVNRYFECSKKREGKDELFSFPLLHLLTIEQSYSDLMREILTIPDVNVNLQATLTSPKQPKPKAEEKSFSSLSTSCTFFETTGRTTTTLTTSTPSSIPPATTTTTTTTSTLSTSTSTPTSHIMRPESHALNDVIPPIQTDEQPPASSNPNKDSGPKDPYYESRDWLVQIGL